MLNWSLGFGGILGIALALSGVGLYVLRTMRPTLARDQDIFFAAVALLCGGILLFQSWRLDPILQFAQFMSAGSAIWFAVEAIRLRAVTTEQAKRTTPVVDEERPVSRVYRAELDDLTPLDEQRTVTRRIRGTRDSYSDAEDYGEESRRRPSSRSNDRTRSADRPRRPRSSSLPPERTSESRGSWDEDFEDKSSRNASSRPGSTRDSSADSSRPRRNRPPQGTSRRRGTESASSSDYVDYQPIDYSDNQADSPKDEW